MTDTFYITTPLYYVNAPPHLGGTYTTIVCDTIARYKRMMGFDVKFLTGTDEHGQKIERSARAEGIEPKALADRVFKQYEALWESIGVSNDLWIRTTDPRHPAAVGEIYRRAKANGFIYKGEYAGWYCVSCEAYAPESDPKEPVACPDCGRRTEWFSEESYFFKLSEFEDRLLEYYEKNPDFIRPETRRNEVASFVKGGLRDLSISRATLKWGVPLPDDPEHVFYVWFEALTGYMTGIGFQSDEATYEKYWPASLHLVGKDILRFHAVYWPAFLIAAELPVPKTVFGHGWWLFNDEKMSKSRGNVFDPRLLKNVFGIEVLRYFLLREMVFGQDCNLRFAAIIQRANSDLANGLGNLLSRTVAMITKYRDGVIPSSGSAKGDEEVERLASEVLSEYRENFDNYAFSRALENLWGVDRQSEQVHCRERTLGDCKRCLSGVSARQRVVSLGRGIEALRGAPGSGDAGLGPDYLGTARARGSGIRRAVGPVAMVPGPGRYEASGGRCIVSPCPSKGRLREARSRV